MKNKCVSGINIKISAHGAFLW